MFGKCLLIGLLIAGISTLINIIFEYNDNLYTRNNTNKRLSIFCIILFVSFIVMFLSSGNQESIVPVSKSMNPLNTNAPF